MISEDPPFHQQSDLALQKRRKPKRRRPIVFMFLVGSLLLLSVLETLFSPLLNDLS
jgi:predicted nucleic acid-binding Zn ribbon protein